ncbi:adenosylcobinamide-phosphate synthase CbiB [Paenibacillus abyssi]|uniref:Cobalamin biosynthesis protein CobD n=1 Tax=Paenibacillus abyssi TaxID=1340531 RepID=A0A917D5G3_9BACL|nr:adenosylcobinamide-phosphate synthase CbiB [Paenibacillus abyssi]GGG11626.1 cobalamin biosynthesis protein CobD [Paenibacillus abyssi]
MIFYSLQEILLMISAALLFDWLIGDPKRPVHPVIRIGQLIKLLEQKLYYSAAMGSGSKARFRGGMLTLITITLSFAAMWLTISLADVIHPWLGYALNTWFISTTIAVKGLKDAAMLVYRPLIEGRMDEARMFTGYIVGRDTDRLDASEASRATVETVAENTVDAVVSPLFYAFLGGAPLAMFYRAANTLDSMVGYKNEKYADFGFASARWDDIMNYLPARLTGLLLLICALPMRGLSSLRGWRSMVRFARLHPSPNSGIPEAAVAGALGVELGGLNYYFGRPSERARMGWPVRRLEAHDIIRTVRLLYGVSILIFAGGLLGWCLITF